MADQAKTTMNPHNNHIRAAFCSGSTVNRTLKGKMAGEVFELRPATKKIACTLITSSYSATSCKLNTHGSAWGPVTLPVFKTGES